MIQNFSFLSFRKLLGILAILVFAPTAASAVETGVESTKIDPPVTVSTKGKIEVIEYFWYGCPHCFKFETTLNAWAKTLPPDVVFVKKHALTGNEKWIPAVRLFYTLDEMKIEEKLHGDVFNAVHIDKLRLDDEKVVVAWIGKNGVDVAKFTEIWNSPQIKKKIQEAKEMTTKSKVVTVPTVVVNGQYAVKRKDGNDDLSAVTKLVDQLIEKVRSETKK